ncbi:MAG: HDOD domain-containing protein [Thermodesulfovibrionales bacterium]|nr:HDOD domain-containing protein [Thermodesulfovibrionales bacterium]
MLNDDLKRLILSTCDIPAVPHVALKVVRLIDAPGTRLDEIQRAILADQALTSRVLKIANSAYYGLRHSVDTVSEAVAIMGFNTLRSLVLAAATKEVYKRFGIIEQKLWEHSLGVSVAASLIARRKRNIKMEEASVAGLLHDVGKALMNNAQPERFMLLMERVYDDRVTFSSVEREYFAFSHSDAGSILAEKWGFPSLLCEVIRDHHSCDSQQGDDPYKDELCRIISLADTLCLKLGVGYRGPMQDIDLKEEEKIRSLFIAPDEYKKIEEEFKNIYLKEKLFFLE